MSRSPGHHLILIFFNFRGKWRSLYWQLEKFLGGELGTDFGCITFHIPCIVSDPHWHFTNFLRAVGEMLRAFADYGAAVCIFCT